VLERFTLLEVPEQDAARVVDRVSGTEVCGQPVRLEPAAT
jgi:hypothetical protein